MPELRRGQILLALPMTAVMGVLPLALRAQGIGEQSASGVAQVSGLSIPDVLLVNQRGEKVHFYSDLVRGKVVAINTIFTTCTTICPLMGANFAKLGKILGDGGGEKLNLISISVDPTDTPERLDQWSRRFGATAPGWTLLTGAKADVDRLLKALRMFTADKLDHSPTVLIGGDGAGDWARPSALLPPARLAELIHARLALLSGHSSSRI